MKATLAMLAIVFGILAVHALLVALDPIMLNL